MRPFVLAALAHARGRQGDKSGPLVVAVPTKVAAEQIYDDLTVFLGDKHVRLFGAWETLPFERVSPEVETMGRRLEVVSLLRDGAGACDVQAGDAQTSDVQHQPALVVVAPIRALLQRLGADARRAPGGGFLEVAPTSTVDIDEFTRRLVSFGYRREHQVEHRGEFAVRGGIVDVFSSTASRGVRLELFGDEVERLTWFSVADQRSVAPCASVRIYPARELRADDATIAVARRLATEQRWAAEHFERFASGELFDGMESWLPWLVEDEILLTDLLGADSMVVLCEPSRLVDRTDDITAETSDLARALVRTWGVDESAGFPQLHVGYDRLLERCEASVLMLNGIASEVPPATEATGASRTQADRLTSRAWQPIVGGAAALLAQLRDLASAASPSWSVYVAADGSGSATRVTESLRAEGLPVGSQTAARAGGPSAGPSAGLSVVVAPLHFSFISPDANVAVLCEHDLSGRRMSHRTARRRTAPAASFEDLNVGDFIVHHHHGIARFAGIVRREFGDGVRDYMELEYRGTDRLYLPTDQLDLIRPYVGGETPTLSKMGGVEFRRQKEKVRSAVNEIAQELVLLYRRRLATVGHAYDTTDVLVREMADTFAYVPTVDQQTAIDDVLADMAADRPMDRLVCGDVGFGKTEVAVRAACCAAANAKQTAVLVPTTLLAQQHHQTFAERFADSGVRVEVLSRFLTPSQQRAVIDGLAMGTVDVVIGTHRLLSADVVFANLGLVVIDEEQRFGVKHKDALKHLKADVDVLTMTATPIPRTLEMSLTGIRDLSLLQTPPAERQPILTHVAPYDQAAVSEAIRRELLREGQVFFVHNRVADIDQVAAQLRELVPEARVAVAHGQMDEGSLEQVVLDFWNGAYDVLVCTTIIESGIDMPTVNTLVVDRADLMGLGQLHQIRGRVGRSGQRAYAYLFHPPNRTLSEQAYERLRTIGESTELGSGYRIAMGDLQLRGAGNLLSGVQSGHIAAVGYDLYCELVSDALNEMEGRDEPKPPEITIDLPVAAYLPDGYVTMPSQRLEAYRRLASVTEAVQVADLEHEWLDRYGPLPAAAETLLHVGLLRVQCVRLGITGVTHVPKPLSPSPRTTSTGRVLLAPMALTRTDAVRIKRLISEARLSGFLTKAASASEPAQLAIGVNDVGNQLVGRLVAVLKGLDGAQR